MKVVASWSGGKESCLACYKAIVDGFDVSYLLNFIDERGERSRSHGLSAELLAAQSKAMGIPILQRKTAWDDYEENFKSAVVQLMESGVKGGVFGDIDLQEHRDWVESVCGELNIEPILPLWKRPREQILGEFIDAGFEAIVVATNANMLGKELLGRKIDYSFINDLHGYDIDLCGESGEYHTFVIDGPMFKRRIEIIDARKILKNNSWILDILDFSVI
jgi:uncharacterized protein (TIGR00290 family)